MRVMISTQLEGKLTHVPLHVCDPCGEEAIPGASQTTMALVGWEVTQDGKDVCPPCSLRFPRTRLIHR